LGDFSDRYRAVQGPGKLNIRNLRTHEDIFTIQTDAVGIENGDAIGIGTTTPRRKLEVNGVVLAQNFEVNSSKEIKDNICDLGSQEALKTLEHLSPISLITERKMPSMCASDSSLRMFLS
jgi:hypothetical protein